MPSSLTPDEPVPNVPSRMRMANIPVHSWCVGGAQKSHGHPGAQLQFLTYSTLIIDYVAMTTPSVPGFLGLSGREGSRTSKFIIHIVSCTQTVLEPDGARQRSAFRGW